MRRFLVAFWAVLLVLNAGSAVFGDFFWLRLVNTAAAIGCVLGLTVEVRRGHRSAARDRDDSDQSAIAADLAAQMAFIDARKAAINAQLAAVTTPIPRAHSGLTETDAEVPILAFKRCDLYWGQGGSFRLVSHHTNQPINLDGDAKCSPNARWQMSGRAFGDFGAATHDAPSVGCNCGFHARKKEEDLEVGYGLVQLDVELSGRVIVHESGYRAQHQRVLRARVTGCYVCGEPVTAFQVAMPAPEGAFPPPARPLCPDHVTAEMVTVKPEIITARLGIPFEVATRADAS